MRRQFTFAHNLHKLLRITSENVRPLTQFMKKYSSYIFYWIKVEVFFKRNSFTREDAVLFFYLVLQFVSRNTQSDSISKRIGDCQNCEVYLNYLDYWWNKFGLNYHQCRLFLGLARTSITRYNSPHTNWSFNFPIQFVSKITHSAMFLFCAYEATNA